MHPSHCAASAWSSLQPSQHADGFSFPPTRKSRLLASPTKTADARDAARAQKAPRTIREPRRSSDQRTNLRNSLHRLLDALDRQTPRYHAVA